LKTKKRKRFSGVHALNRRDIKGQSCKRGKMCGWALLITKHIVGRGTTTVEIPGAKTPLSARNLPQSVKKKPGVEKKTRRRGRRSVYEFVWEKNPS